MPSTGKLRCIAPVEPKNARVAEAEHAAVPREEPVALARSRRRDRVDRLRERDAAGRAVEVRVAEAEHAAVGADHPVAAAIARARRADHHPRDRGSTRPNPRSTKLPCARDAAETVDDRVALVVGARQQRDRVAAHVPSAEVAAVADPLPVPRLRARAAARLRERRMVPSERARDPLHERVAGARERQRLPGIGEIGRLAPTVVRVADGRAGRRRADRRDTRGVVAGLVRLVRELHLVATSGR